MLAHGCGWISDKLFGKAHFSTYHTYEPTGTAECLRSSASYPDTWFGPYTGFEHVELMLVGHNWWAPEKPPAGQHYERFYHMDGKGEERTKLMWENAGDTKGPHRSGTPNCPWPITTRHGQRTARLNGCATGAIRTSRFAHGSAFLILTTRSTAPSHGRGCMTLPRSICPRTARAAMRVSRGGTKRRWRASLPIQSLPTSAKLIAASPQTDEQLREIIANTYGQISFNRPPDRSDHEYADGTGVG